MLINIKIKTGYHLLTLSPRSQSVKKVTSLAQILRGTLSTFVTLIIFFLLCCESVLLLLLVTAEMRCKHILCSSKSGNPAGLFFTVTYNTPFPSISSLYGRAFLLPAGSWNMTGSCNAVGPVSATCSPLFILVLVDLLCKKT